MITISNKVVDVALGKTVSTAVDDKGLVWSWGSNEMGELGVGDGDARVHPFPVLNLKGKFVSKASCGDSFVMCLGKDIKKGMPSLDLTEATQ